MLSVLNVRNHPVFFWGAREGCAANSCSSKSNWNENLHCPKPFCCCLVSFSCLYCHHKQIHCQPLELLEQVTFPDGSSSMCQPELSALFCCCTLSGSWLCCFLGRHVSMPHSILTWYLGIGELGSCSHGLWMEKCRTELMENTRWFLAADSMGSGNPMPS